MAGEDLCCVVETDKIPLFVKKGGEISCSYDPESIEGYVHALQALKQIDAADEYSVLCLGIDTGAMQENPK